MSVLLLHSDYIEVIHKVWHSRVRSIRRHFEWKLELCIIAFCILRGFCSFVSLFGFDTWFIQWNWMANATIKSWSKYFLDLPPGQSEAKKRYKEKMSLAGFSEDPCCRLETKGKGSNAVVSVEWTNWPDISWPDIYNYLILMPGVTLPMSNSRLTRV